MLGSNWHAATHWAATAVDLGPAVFSTYLCLDKIRKALQQLRTNQIARLPHQEETSCSNSCQPASAWTSGLTWSSSEGMARSVQTNSESNTAPHREQTLPVIAASLHGHGHEGLPGTSWLHVVQQPQ
jgi:hypothetical protein